MIIPLENAFAYDRNQATSSANDCGNGQIPTNVGCQNIGSSIQGDENAVNIIGQQRFPAPPPTVEPPPPPPADTATLTIKKIVQCEAGVQCPNLPANLPVPDDFLISIDASVDPDPDPVDGSATGKPVTLNPGEYTTTEKGPTEEVPEGLVFVETKKSEDCDSGTHGPIRAGEVRECMFTNIYKPDPTRGTLTLIKKVECVAGAQCPNLPSPSDFRLAVLPLARDTISFPGSAEGTTVSLEPVAAYLTAEFFPEVPDGLRLVGDTHSGDCVGSIRAGDVKTCTFTNIYAPL